MIPYRRQTFSSIIRDMNSNRNRANTRLYQFIKAIPEDIEDIEEAYDQSHRPIQQQQVTKKKLSSITHSIKELGTMTIKELQNNKNEKQAKQTKQTKHEIKNTFNTNNSGLIVSEKPKILEQEILCKHFCGCGQFSMQSAQMIQHIKMVHNRKYIKGSSHSLTIFGNLVFAWPQQNQAPKNIKIIMNSQPFCKFSYIEYEPIQPQLKTRARRKRKAKNSKTKKQSIEKQKKMQKMSIQKTTFSKQSLEQKHTIMNKQSEQKRTITNNKIQPIKNTIVNTELLSPIKSKNQKKYVYSAQPTGKQFQNSHCQNYLCLKNDSCKSSLQEKKNYKCGVCGIQYERQYYFKKHVLVLCRILNHESSSHHLIKKDQSNWNFTQNLILQQEKKSKSQQPVQLVQIANQQYWKFQYESEVRLNQQNQQAYCNKCEKNFCYAQNYATHILSKHTGIVPKGSSHILIRITRKNIKQALLMPINSKSQFLQSSKYVCPCKLQVEMSKSEFVNHVMKRHKGKTPLMRMAGANQ